MRFPLSAHWLSRTSSFFRRMRKRKIKDESEPIKELSELAKGVGPVFNSENKRKTLMGISQFRRLKAGTALQALAVMTVLLFTATNARADYLNLLTAGSSGQIGS